MIGKFSLGFVGQTVANADGLWNSLGMMLEGWVSILLGGCPLRQLVLSVEGNIDSVMKVFGLVAWAAFCHNFALAASAKGPSANGKIAVVVGFLDILLISYLNMENVAVKEKGETEV